METYRFLKFISFAKALQRSGWLLTLFLLFLIMTVSAQAGSYQHTQDDAAVGAALGAAAGQVIGQDTESTLIGAGLGLIFGGIHGQYRDRAKVSKARNSKGAKVRNAPPVFEGIGAFPEYVETSDLYQRHYGQPTRD